MKDIRIGNDISVKWSLLVKGTSDPFDLSGLPLKLYLKNMYGRKEVEDFSVDGNVILWTFFGKDQKHTGKYSLELVANEGVEGMMTTDICDLVRLVSCSCKVGDGTDGCGVETETIEVQSEVEFVSGTSIEVDTMLNPNSPNPIANFAVYGGLEDLRKQIDTNKVLTFDSLVDAEKLKEVFNYWRLEKFLNQPISCYIKTEGNEERYEIATLVVEKYDEDYKLNFIRFDATSQFRMYDENGEDTGHYNQEWQWSPKCRLINGICDSYLIQSNGYVMHLGKGALIIADDELDATSERPVSNKALCKALQDIKLFELVESLPAEGRADKVYLVVNKNGQYGNNLIEWIWIRKQWEKLGEFKADVDLSEYAKKGDLATINGKRIDEGGNIEIEGGGSSYDDTEIRQELTELSEGIALRNVGAEDTDESVDEPEIGGGGGGGMSTPSGDPMHYMFEAAGATYNATNEDIPMVGIYGDSYVHKAKHWHLNELGDITNEEIRTIYTCWKKTMDWAAYAPINGNFPIRTNFPFLGLPSKGFLFEVNTGTSQVFQSNRNLVKASVFWPKDWYGYHNLSELFAYCYSLETIIGVLGAASYGSAEGMFRSCLALKDVQITHLKQTISFVSSSKLSNASILYMIENEAATSAIVITLHADAYARAMADEAITSALEAHPNVSLASA